MKRALASLLLVLVLCACLPVQPASAAGLTAYDAVNTFESFMKTPPANPDPYVYPQSAGYFYIDLDGNGIPEMGAVYFDPSYGSTAIVFYYIDAAGSVRQILCRPFGEDSLGDSYFYSDIGGSGGTFAEIDKQSDGTYRLSARMHFYGTDESVVLKYDGAGAFVNTSEEVYETAFVLNLYRASSAPARFAFFAQPKPVLLAYASTQTVTVDGKPVQFQMYALKDEKGNYTNYVKVRDVAYVLNGTAAQFNVGWNGAVNLESGKSYVPNGTEMTTPYSGDRAYTPVTTPTNVDGVAAALDCIALTDDAGGGYTYYKLRDLGNALGFYVDWTREAGITVDTLFAGGLG